VTQPVVVRELGFQRGSFALGPLSFDVPAGGRLAVVGPSGSGKTTLLRCLAGLERPARGSIAIGAQVVADERTNVPPDRRGVGLVFQDGALWSHMTALQHLQFAAPGLSANAARALLERGGLLHLAARKPASLSGGEAQRLGLLRAIAPAPGVLLLDEPLRSVDVHQRDALVLLLRTLTDERGLTSILVTHDRDEALALATDLVVLHEGRLVEQGPALRLLREPQTAFTAAFLAGAACLPTTADGGARVRTPFGAFDRPAGVAADLRLVLLPGDTTATAPGAGSAGATGRVLATLPADDGFTVRVALGDQIVQARAATGLPTGTTVLLTLRRPVRLLPWDRGASAPPLAAEHR
jgi:iron(III) transport system ATP-binding protein